MKTFDQFQEARLTADQRRALPNKDFALPGKGEGPKGKQAGSYPIPDEKHARSALSLVSQHGTPEEKATVRAKVKKKFPDIQQESMGGGVPLTPQELEIQKKMSRLNVRLARKRSQEMQKAKIKDTETAPEQVKEAKSAAWQRKEGKRESGGLNQKGVDSYRRENPGSKLKTAVTTKPSKLKKGSKSANRRKSFCARMSGMKKKLTSAKTANDPDSRINKSLRKWNCSYEPDGTPIMEEDKAFNFVLDKIRKEVGKDGYVSKNNPRKPQTPQQKAKVRAHQAKVDKENAAERKKDPSQGRYPKG